MSDGPSWQPPGGENLPPPPPGSGWGAQPDSGGWSQASGAPPTGGGGPPAPPYGGEEIPNYLVWSILTTVFCCLPLGIVSIVFAAQVGGKQAAGDIAGARDASRKARTWAIVSAVVGVAWIVIIFVFVFAVGIFGAVGELGPVTEFDY